METAKKIADFIGFGGLIWGDSDKEEAKALSESAKQTYEDIVANFQSKS